MSDEKIVDALRGVSGILFKIVTSLNHISNNLDRMTSVLESLVEKSNSPASIVRSQSSPVMPAHDIIHRVTKRSLPDVSGCNVVQFYGPSFQDTKFVADCVFHKMSSAVIVTEFETKADCDVAMEKLSNEPDPFGRRSKESGCSSHIVVGWNSSVAEIRDDASVHVHRTEEGKILWTLFCAGRGQSGRVDIGPA